MNKAKFNMNSLLVIIIVFLTLWFFVNVWVFNNAKNVFIINDNHAIEGTDLWIHYGTVEPSGIYKGRINTMELELEGTYGYEWGLAIVGNDLYLNEYLTSDLGMTFCNLVRVDMNTFEKETVAEDTILRGRCASGELVCLGDCLLPSNEPTINSLCKLYGMSSKAIHPESNTVTVFYIDPMTGETVYVRQDTAVMTKVFQKRYLDRTLEEVRQ
ncbi:MAG: hypothetical protein IJH91_00800 [Mogibacterium sp.]|nr:hypothetical protein [Mogibacterium sp.]